MIPNQAKFDLSLNDLPVRATQVSPEALSLSGTNGKPYISIPFTSSNPNPNNDCKGICILEGRLYYGVAVGSGGRLWCRCYK